MLVFFSNGNDGQFDMYRQLVKSLRKHISAEIKLVFASDNLSINCVNQLESMNVEFFSLSKIFVENFNQTMESNVHAFGKIAKPFILKEYFESVKLNKDDTFIFLDPDIICQGPIDRLLELAPNNGVVFAHQFDMANTNSSIATRFAKSGNSLDDFDEQREINTGFFLGKVVDVFQMVNSWSEFMLMDENRYLKDHDNAFSSKINAWHDQDFFRLFMRKARFKFELKFIGENYVAHLCDSLCYKMSTSDNYIVNNETGKRPILVHFAGGSHNVFYSIAKLYGRKKDFYKYLFIGKPKSLILQVLKLFNLK